MVWAYGGIGGNVADLLGAEGLTRMGGFVSQMFPPDLSAETLTFLIQPTIETLQISLLGTVFAAVFAFPLALLAARNVVLPGGLREKAPRHHPGYLVYLAARALLSALRAVPDVVWALIFIAAVGLGPFPGVLALTVHNTGVLGKLYSEFIESVNPKPVEALEANGANRVQAFFYGMAPQALPEMLAYTLYRWECNIRAAAILGFVGAGGIGFYTLLSVKLLQYDQLLTTILLIFLLVVFVDGVSALIRRKVL